MGCETTVNNSARKQYGAVDIVRMFMAICVLFIHRGYATKNEAVFFVIRNSICELAVPFFVCTTAFFIYRKLNGLNDSEKKIAITKYFKRLFILFAVWSIIYLPSVFYKDFFVGGESFITVVKNYLIKFVFGGKTYLHLWYIQALLVSSIIIYFLQKRIPVKILFPLFWALYVLYVFGMKSDNQIISDFYSQIPAALINYFCRISVFIVAGKMLAENRLFEKNFKKSGAAFLVSVLISVLFFAFRYKNECVGAVLQMAALPFVIISLFSFCISIDFSFKKEGDLRKITELFYFTHLLIPVELYDLVFSKLGKINLAYNIVFLMFFYTAFALIVSVVILRLSKTKVFGFLKYLY